MSLENNPQILSLIQAVRKNKILYDTQHVNYLDADERTNRIWEDVALECGYDNGADAEKAWKDLKTNFMTNFHSKFIPNGIEKSNESGSDDSNCWDYYREMRFILQFTAVNTDPGENFLNISKSKKSEDSIQPITISSVRASVETQTPLENIRMDIPAICEANMTENELCLRNYFDAIYRATCTLPLKWQNKVKRDMLQSLNSAEILADADRRTSLRAKQQNS